MLTMLDSLSGTFFLINKELRIVLFNKSFGQWCKKLGLQADIVDSHIMEIGNRNHGRIQQGEASDNYASMMQYGNRNKSTVEQNW